ncbi:UDP-glucose:undecaprenyl-phosphate glucose-1-phosphate transferase [Rosistilla carotiformis]|uniref:UDP-glucose:undecaprenyl-phosphate glucose-1-phosphate transferase n=1 Tax=Rosistilla carotiformis TaxID=2528017 RepID=A0A518JWA8_9BACT|nr:exopolysaccharide biosynthesis polyprenyl glycosylphosphotransferase [Rosistilla carotiformis]QDV69826.1 UDP-glucose:undecaprenyl-phosphate glucose-1-phosphate transferase [Rosistilla carotiformis]
MTTLLLSHAATVERTPELRLEPEVAIYLGKRLLVQRLATSLPLVAVDAAVVVSLITILEALVGLPVAFENASLGTVMSGSLCWVLLLASYQLYPAIGLNPAIELKRYTCASSIATCLLAIGVLGFSTFDSHSVTMLAMLWAGSVVALPAARWVARRQLARTTWWGMRCVVVGESATEYFNGQSPWNLAKLGYRVLGYVRCSDPYWESYDHDSGGLEYLGPTAELHDICRSVGAPSLLVSDDQNDFSEKAMGQLGLHIPLIERLEFSSGGYSQERCPGLFPLSHTENGLLQPGNLLLKRCLDLVAVIAATPVLIPVMVAIGLAIKLTAPGPIFYRHRRVGRYGREIQVWKFRTMVQNADQVLQQHLDENPQLRREWELDHKLKKDPRVTRVGAILRKTSLDELPQLINVLMDEMSLVGPRPIVSAEVEKYAEAYPLYIAVQPGLTGLWQVNGRNNTTYERRIELDRRYVSSWSVWLDCYILLRTIKTVAFCEGAY